MNKIEAMWPICHVCPYWEVCDPPYICEATEQKLRQNKPTKNNEVQEMSKTKIKSAAEVAWSRIGELADAIMIEYESANGDAEMCEKWANEIIWQACIITSMKEEESDDEVH